ncbi:hypothetical protein GCM10017783_11930 [Deinococcus piscis]|uniref:Uncharacterized protein n=1 Tax=Deinococcus piscis TaxID=394230 RepID=A0ABQ3K5X6_9DEIO|nr:hypothetical protein GCM10017783_11930 [Deinococcus piscis]
MVGSTALAQQLPLPIWGELLGQWSLDILQLLRGWGGWILPLQGDAALACWPAWQAEAAVGAAQQAHGMTAGLPLAQTLGQSLTLRAGLAAGELTLLPYQEPRPCGLPLHLAHRLSSVADPGETLLCAEVARTLEAQPGSGRSILQRRTVPPLQGFETLQSSGAAFYRVLLPAEQLAGAEMKAG